MAQVNDILFEWLRGEYVVLPSYHYLLRESYFLRESHNLPLKFKLFGKFKRVNATDGSMKTLKIGTFPKIPFKMRHFKRVACPKQRSA